MATFSFGGISVDSNDPDFVKNAEAAIIASGGSIGGSIVAGNSYGHTGGTVTGDVVMGGKSASKCTECGRATGHKLDCSKGRGA